MDSLQALRYCDRYGLGKNAESKTNPVHGAPFD
jgi:hypothetical protein